MTWKKKTQILDSSISKVSSVRDQTFTRNLMSLVDTGEEGEESKFSSGRAKLYGWEDKAWKERGAGVFRFNLSTSDTTDHTQQRQKARFIMRAHQTYRVLLNTPVFKEMMVGDPLKKGEEPTSKSLLIAVVTEEGKAVPKAVPYLIRVSLRSSPSITRHLLTFPYSSMIPARPGVCTGRCGNCKSSSNPIGRAWAHSMTQSHRR